MEEIPLLKDYQWKKTYKSIHGNLVKEFLIPALERSILYRRVAGYFSSSVLAVAAAGIAKILKNEGEMQLIVGTELSRKDVEAINQDPEKIYEIIKEKIPDNLDNLEELERFITEKRFEVLSWLIHKQKLKIKVALVLDENNNIAENQNLDPYFHDKWGIFYDREGNHLGFIGSVNESRQGWLKNHERIKVYASWDVSYEYLRDDVEDFISYWNNTEPGLKVYDITQAIEQKLIKYRKSIPPSKDPFEEPDKFPKKPKSESKDPNKLLGVYGGLKFMHPEEFKFKQIAGFIDASLGIQHNWNTLFNTISFDPMMHQEIIAYEVYKNYPRGYILCDEVGLGKTIEAGLALKWLILAGRIKRILIIVPKNIVKQWQEELREKFNLDFYIYDGKKLISYWDEKYKARTYNVYNAVDLVLVSSGLVQLKKRKKELLNAFNWDLIIFDESHHLRRKPPKRLGGEGAPTRLLSLAQELKKKTKSFLLMTATPIQMRIQEVFDLLKLLGLGGNWGIKEKFDRFYEIIDRKVENRNLRDWEFLVEMAKDYLEWGRIDKDFYENELIEIGGDHLADFKKIFIKEHDFRAYLENKLKNIEYLREFSNELEVLSPLRWFMFRNTRNQLKEYGIHVPYREPKDEPINMKVGERTLYRRIETYLREIYKKSTPEQKSIIGFTLAIYRRRLTSSFTAIKKTLERRLDLLKNEKEGKIGLKLFSDEDLEDDLIEEYDVDISDIEVDLEAAESIAEEDDLLEILEPDKASKKKEKRIFLAKDTLDEEIEFLENFIIDIEDFLERNQESKFEKFKSLLDEANLKDAKKVLVFTQYTDTLKFLRKRLRDNPNYQDMGCYSGSGGEFLLRNDKTGEFVWESKSKEEIKNWFFEEGGFKILLCTDAASEGLNFQVCNWMINYDLPWNPMKVEQRIGRIDRVNQRAEKLFIINLLYNETIEGRIYKKLWDRIKLFQNVIGPLRPILNVYQKAERFAIEEGDDALSEEEIEKMLGNIKEQTKKAQSRHDFFLRLLKRRITPNLEVEKETPPIIEINENFNWLESYFSINNFNPNTLRNSIQLQNKEDKRLILSLMDENRQDLFINKNDKIFKGKAKKEKRNFSNIPFNFSITLDREYFTAYPSNYYFTSHCAFFSNFLDNFLPYKERYIPSILKGESLRGDNIKSALVLARIVISRYPLFNKEYYLIIEIDLKSNIIQNVSDVKNYNNYLDEFSNITSELNEKEKFFEKLSSWEISLNKIKEIIRKAIRDNELSSFIPEFSLKIKLDSLNWKEVESSFNSLKKSFKIEIKSEIIKWLIMEYLSNLRDEDWKNFPEQIYLQDYYENLVEVDGWEKIIEIINLLKLNFESLKMSSDNDRFIDFNDQYKSKKRRKLLKADQGRLRARIINLIEKYEEDMRVFNSRKMEFIRLTKINNPQILVCGIIFK